MTRKGSFGKIAVAAVLTVLTAVIILSLSGCSIDYGDTVIKVPFSVPITNPTEHVPDQTDIGESSDVTGMGDDSAQTGEPSDSVSESSADPSVTVTDPSETTETDVPPEVHTHTYGEWSITASPTCTEQGSRERTCICGDKQIEKIPAIGHKPAVLPAKEPDCIDTGLTAGSYCSVCKAVLIEQKTIPALGHDLKNGVCSRCGDGKSSVGLELVLNSDGKSYSVKSIGGCSDIMVTVPAVNRGYPVTAILDRAFSGNSKIKKITLPESIRSVGKFAFSGCTALKEVKINDGTVTVDIAAFKDCTALESVSISDSVSVIGSDAFSGCTSLNNIVIGNGVINIGPNAFSNTGYCNNSANKKNGVIYIGNYLIRADKSVSGNYTVESSTKAIASCAFLDCKELTEITLPERLAGIGSNAFSGCSKLKEIYIFSGVSYIGSGIVNGCSSVNYLTVESTNEKYYSSFNCIIDRKNSTVIAGCKDAAIPATGITAIGDYAFSQVTTLTGIIIPDSVTSIGDYAFLGCSGLKKVVLGSGVRSIGAAAFKDCPLLKTITVSKGITKIGNLAFANTAYCSNNRGNDGIIYLGDYLIDADTAISGICRINSGTTLIADNAFKGCGLMVAVEIPDTVEYVGAGAFCDCSGLLRVSVGKNVCSIGKGAFVGDEKLDTAEFSVASGWKRSDGAAVSAVELSKTSTAAAALRTSNSAYEWTR